MTTPHEPAFYMIAGILIGYWTCYVLWYMTRLGARIWFRVKCPCCKKEIIIDPQNHEARHNTFEDQEEA